MMTVSLLGRRALLGMAALLATSGPALAATTPAPLMVIAEIVAKPESADTIRATMKTLAANALKEKGCLAYTLYEDRDHAGRFLTYETWTGDDALTAHLTSPAMKAGAATLGAMLAQAPVITKLKRP